MWLPKPARALLQSFAMNRTRTAHRLTVPRATCASWLALCALVACGSPDHPKSVDERPASSRLARSPRRAVDHGGLTFQSWTPTTITRSAFVHTWTFTLTGRAAIQLRTEASSEGDIDTVLSLYREGQRGWGIPFARNDDVPDGVRSELELELDAGRYRAMVTGRHPHVVGTFILASECSGAGCPAQPAQCLFGDSFYELLHGGEAEVQSLDEAHITSIEQLADGLSRAQLVLAVQQSSHSDVTTAEQALSRVDERTVRRLSLLEPTSGRRYTALEYGVGDNSYGAIFIEGTQEIAARIHDGDYLDCTAYAQPCLLPDSLVDLRESEAFEASTSSVLTRTSVALLSLVERAQLLATLRVNYSEVDAPTLESAIEQTDGASVHQLYLRQLELGRELVIYEYRAGDTSVGAVFERADEEMRAVISDGAFEDCRILR
jgi:hypothetical protein